MASGIGTDGKDTTSNIRIRSQSIGIVPQRIYRIEVPSGYKFKVCYYTTSSAATFIHADVNWTVGGIQRVRNQTTDTFYIRVLVGYTDDAVISDVDSVSANVSIIREVQKEFALSSDVAIISESLSDVRANLNAENNAILAQINSIHNYINYEYGNDEQIGSTTIFQRRKTSLVVNGSSESSPRVKISGDLEIATGNSGVRDWSTGIQLEEGATYRFSYQFLSGSVTVPDGIGLPVLSVYPVGESTSIGTTERVGNAYTRTFIAPAGEINLAFFVAANTTFANAEYVLLLEKVSESDAKITPYINPLSVGLYGDSICKGTIISGVYATKNFSEYIVDELGYGATNNAVGGSGYCKRSDMESLSDAVIANGVNFGAILLFAGTNDYGYNKSIGTIDDVPSNTTSSTFYAAVKYLIEYIYANNPTCQVMIVTPIFRNYHANGGTGNTYTNIENTAGFTLGDFCDALVAIGKYYNIPVFDMRENSVVNFLNYTEKLTETGTSTGKYLHPTDAAYPTIYKKLVKWIHTII